jgi:uncharacterized protein
MTGSGGQVASAGHGGTPQPERKLAPDLARGVMLLLIAMAYAGVYAGVAFGSRLPEGTSVADTVARFVVVLVLDNRAFPMFAILYGYGLAWMVARRRRAGAADAEIRRLLRRRSLLLVAIGSVHAFLVFPGEILASYGLAGLVLGWLLFRSDRTVARTIAVLVPCYVVTVTAAMVSLAAAPDVAGYAVPGTPRQPTGRCGWPASRSLRSSSPWPIRCSCSWCWASAPVAAGCSTTRPAIARS